MFFFYIKKSPPPHRAPSELIPALPASSGFTITLGTPKSFKCSRKILQFGLWVGTFYLFRLESETQKREQMVQG